ncbi:MAG: metallophosphoesterase [Bradymonadales bacterium]|nr:metallophosphoesterase [Bradymonadales bacterium]
MSRTVQFSIFIALMLGFTLAIHWYLWLRLVRDTALPPPWSTVQTVLLVALLVGIPTAFFLWHLWPSALSRWIVVLIYCWMGLAFFLLFLFLAVDLFKLGGWIIQKVAPFSSGISDAGRRLLVARITALSVLAVGLLLATVGVVNARREVTVRRLELTLPRLPAALDGFTLVQLTDLHLGPTLGRSWLAEIVEQVNALSPDLVAITGDLADGMVDHLREEVAPLQHLEAPYGIYFVTGNHEYYAGFDQWMGEIEQLGLEVLRNRWVSIPPEGDGFDLVGIDDPEGARMVPGHTSDLETALAGRDPSRELVLLAHQPRVIDQASHLGVGLQLSGHTHAGQIWPWSYLVYLQQPYVYGLHRHGDTWLYVSSGAGYWGPPMRLGTRSEIVHVTLRSAQQAP